MPIKQQVVEELRRGDDREGNAGSSRGVSRTRTQLTGNDTRMFFQQVMRPELVTRPNDARFSKVGMFYLNLIQMKDNTVIDYFYLKSTGTEGSSIEVQSNYFHLTKRPDIKLLQYRVDFTPEIEHPGVQKALVRVHEPIIGKYIFDGTLLYNTKKLPQVIHTTISPPQKMKQFKFLFIDTAAGIIFETNFRRQ